MELLVREIPENEVEQEITQRDQFNTDTVGIAETIVREAHQNSMDGRSTNNGAHVCTRIRLITARGEDAEYWGELFAPLRPHLEASGVNLTGIDLAKPRLLVIEDFGTTGLLGSTDRKDDRNFSDFWRRMGKSHKRGEQGGRWGLGKLVFSSASRIRTFFGVTVQEEDVARTPLLMGQAVLTNHFIGANPRRDFAPHAFFAVQGARNLQLPERDPVTVGEFAAATGLERGTAPGLSIVVPFVHEDITCEAMLPHIIRNWFFPILTGKLVVEIGAHTLNAATFAELAKEFGGPEFADGRRVAFISELHSARAAVPVVTLASNWIADGIEKSVPESTLESLRANFAAGKLIEVRAPINLRAQGGPTQTSFVDLYLRTSLETPRGEALYIRGAITIPGEAKRFRGRNCVGALVAEDALVAAFLGDAEGPAHTTWSGTAEKVRANWKNPGERLREIREALNQFVELVARPNDRVDPDALKNFFFVPKGAQTKVTRRKNPVICRPVVPPIPRKPTPYRIEQRDGGIIIKGDQHTTVPMEIRLKAAYDVVEGDAVKQHSKYDFDMTAGEIAVNCSGASVQVISANELQIDVTEPRFSVELFGFDANRDLFVRDRRP